MRDELALRSVIESLSQTLNHIQEKLKHAHVLNGGFDLLMEKIEGIEEKEIVKSKQITDIHSALYDPDKGLHARLSLKADDSKMELLKAEVDKQKQLIEDVQRWKSIVTKIVLAGLLPIITTFGKILYDLLATHIQLK